jgi:hypothetical protein
MLDTASRFSGVDPMLERKIAVLLLVFAAVPVTAEGSQTITVSPQACAAVTHQNDAPGVAYQSGVDATGKSVAPADLPGSGNAALNEKLAGTPIKITVDVQRRFGIPANANLFHGRGEVGYVTVKDGKAYLDGVPLESNEEGLLTAACRDQMKKGQ